MIVNGFFHELVDFLGDFLSSIEECLLLIILPVQSQIEYADCLPEITQLRASAVDSSSRFVGDDELEILHK